MKHDNPLSMIGRAINAQRVAMGQKQGDLADNVGITQTYLSLIENGHKLLSLPTLWSICVCLEVPMSRIIQLAEDIYYHNRRRRHDQAV